jgi:peptidoglycan/xylan/chitin deacetylase (PgdA/CDA1 family)
MRISPMYIWLIPILCILLGVILWLQPEWIIARLRQTSPDVLYAVDIQAPYIALTIDDGPDADSTPRILDLLNQFNAKATFFLIADHIPGNEAIVHRMVSEGHDLGNHMTSDEPSIQLSIQAFDDKLSQADDALSHFAETHWFRPGSGWYNEEMLEVIDAHDYQCVLGSVYPYDPQIGSAWFSIRYILWKVNPGDVIVLHDHRARGNRTVEVLETLLPELTSRGFKLVTLSELDRISKSINH